MTLAWMPNEADASDNAQAEPDSVDFEILLAAYQRTGVLSGCEVTVNTGTVNASNTLQTSVGEIEVAGEYVSVAADTTVSITTADGSNPRLDLVVVNDSGVVSVTAGTAAASPVFPAIPADSVVLAAVHVPASDTTIAANQIVDKRVLLHRTVLPTVVTPTTGAELKTVLEGSGDRIIRLDPAFTYTMSSDVTIDLTAGRIFYEGNGAELNMTGSYTLYMVGDIGGDGKYGFLSDRFHLYGDLVFENANFIFIDGFKQRFGNMVINNRYNTGYSEFCWIKGHQSNYSGGPFVEFDRAYDDRRTYTWNASTGVLDLGSAHGYENGDRVSVFDPGTPSSGLGTTTTYYVVQKTTNTFKVSLTVGGGPVTGGTNNSDTEIGTRGDASFKGWELYLTQNGGGYSIKVQKCINLYDGKLHLSIWSPSFSGPVWDFSEIPSRFAQSNEITWLGTELWLHIEDSPPSAGSTSLISLYNTNGTGHGFYGRIDYNPDTWSTPYVLSDAEGWVPEILTSEGTNFFSDLKEFSSDFTLLSCHPNVDVDCTGASRTVSLQAADATGGGGPTRDYAIGVKHTIRRASVGGSNTVTVDCDGSDTFDDGSGSIVLTRDGESITFISNGVDGWILLSHDLPYHASAIETAATTTTLNVHSGPIVNVDSSGGTRTVNLPTCSSVDGKEFFVRRDGTNTVNIDSGTDTFSDDAGIDKALGSDGAWIHFFSTGGNEWKVLGTGGTVT